MMFVHIVRVGVYAQLLIDKALTVSASLFVPAPPALQGLCVKHAIFSRAPWLTGVPGWLWEDVPSFYHLNDALIHSRVKFK